jgi:hypothetical protein
MKAKGEYFKGVTEEELKNIKKAMIPKEDLWQL